MLGDFPVMVPKHPGRRAATPHEPCCVCGVRDARALVTAVLVTGDRVTLCGCHDLMHRRAGGQARSADELREKLGERRSMQRRASGVVDELAERLAAAFTTERRVGQRRTA